MEKEKLKELVIEYKDRFFAESNLISREIQKNINRFLITKEIILITGVRRSGKSSLMKLIADDLLNIHNVPKSNILYLNFEDERFIEFKHKDFDALHEVFLELENPQGKKYFFLDEIQNIEGWEKWANRLYEFENVKFFITGSNAAMLSSDVSAALTGRNRQIINWPFSFSEFLNLRGISIDANDFYKKEKRVIIKRLLKEYTKFGGFPEVLKQKDTDLLDQYFKDILYRDLIAKYSLKNIRELKEICLHLFSNVGAIFSYANLKSMVSAKSVNTVKNYLEILENVFLFFKVPLFDYSVKKQIYNPDKFYAIDSALSQTIGFKFSSNIGHIYENIVFLELKRRNKDLYYWKCKSGKEVDFIIRSGAKIEEAIQVCFNFVNEKTKKREIEGLLKAKLELKPRKFTIISEDEMCEEKIGNINIQIIPLWKWLLSK